MGLMCECVTMCSFPRLLLSSVLPHRCCFVFAFLPHSFRAVRKNPVFWSLSRLFWWPCERAFLHFSIAPQNLCKYARWAYFAALLPLPLLYILINLHSSSKIVYEIHGTNTEAPPQYSEARTNAQESATTAASERTGSNERAKSSSKQWKREGNSVCLLLRFTHCLCTLIMCYFCTCSGKNASNGSNETKMM